MCVHAVLRGQKWKAPPGNTRYYPTRYPGVLETVDTAKAQSLEAFRLTVSLNLLS